MIYVIFDGTSYYMTPADDVCQEDISSGELEVVFKSKSFKACEEVCDKLQEELEQCDR